MGNYFSGNILQKIGTSTVSFLKQAALLSVAGAVAGGVIVGFGTSRPQPTVNTSLTDQHIAANILAQELTAGCVAAGTSSGCVFTVVGVTNNQFIFSHSGGLIVGSFANPRAALSGSLLRIGGGWPRAGEPLSVIGTMSGAKVVATPTSGTAAIVGYGAAKGSHICLRDTDGAGWTSYDCLNGTCGGRVASAGECP